MTEAPGFFPCVSRDELRERKQKKEKYETPSIDEVGQSRCCVLQLLVIKER